MKKGGGSESTIIIGPSKSVLVHDLHSLQYVLGLARFRLFVPKLVRATSVAAFLLVYKIIDFKSAPAKRLTNAA